MLGRGPMGEQSIDATLSSTHGGAGPVAPPVALDWSVVRPVVVVVVVVVWLWC